MSEPTALFGAPEGVYQLREPCRWCGGHTGHLRPRGGQNCVYCSDCGRHVYNAPKTETGEVARSVRSRPNVKPSQRARIIERDNATCVGCHRDDVIVHVGHLLSVEDGRSLGATDAELFSDENLAVLCEECNLGFSSRSVSLRFVYRLLQVRVRMRGSETT